MVAALMSYLDAVMAIPGLLLALLVANTLGKGSFNQPPNSLRTAWQIGLLAAPRIKLCQELARHPHPRTVQ